jgi:cytochrome c peroxidase
MGRRLVERLPGSTESRLASLSRSLLSIALICWLAADARAHGGEQHESSGTTAEIEGAAAEPADISSASPAAAFARPAPGTYALPPLGEAADGDVLTSEGQLVRLHDLFGSNVVVLSFVYTQCSDAEGCPLATAVLHDVGSRLAREPETLSSLRLLSLSFDPDRDTPEVMRAYGESFRRGDLDWRFLTTRSNADLAPLLSAYRQTRVPEINAEGEPTGQFSHLLRVFLIDRAGAIRQVYSTSLLDPEALIADVKTILLEDGEGDAFVSSSASFSPSAPPSGFAESAVAASRSGDDRTGYRETDYETQSLALAARRGRAMDLFQRVSEPPLGLPEVPVPEDNPLTREKVMLGRRLFFERRLSHNDSLSCAMCHVPEQGFASNEMATSVGIEGRSVRRNAPTIYNTAYLSRLFHDGRETSLEHQIWGPLLAPNEMGNPSVGAVLTKLRTIGGYVEEFERAFPGRGLTMSTLGMALASYERTLVSGNSAFDRSLFGAEPGAMSPEARRGFALFSGAAGCSACHTLSEKHALLTDNDFHNTGVGYRAAMGIGTGEKEQEGRTQRIQVAPGVHLDVPRDVVAQVSEPPSNDLGRYEITRDPADNWRYRTPTLRNVALSAPYMHDGSLATLRDVVEFYRGGGVPNEGLDPRIRALDLSDRQVDDVVAFLESLTGSDVEGLVLDAYAAPVGDLVH